MNITDIHLCECSFGRGVVVPAIERLCPHIDLLAVEIERSRAVPTLRLVIKISFSLSLIVEENVDKPGSVLESGPDICQAYRVTFASPHPTVDRELWLRLEETAVTNAVEAAWLYYGIHLNTILLTMGLPPADISPTTPPSIAVGAKKLLTEARTT